MADNSMIAGLFSTPEQYQAGLQQQALGTGVQLAQLTPSQRGEAQIYAGANQLGRGLGGAMGVQDTQMQLISARNAVMRQIDQTDPASIMRGAQALAQIDPQGANALANMARQAAELQAKTGKEVQQTATLKAQEQQAIAGKKPAKVLEAEAVADAKQAMETLQEGTPEYKRQANLVKALESGNFQVTEMGVPGQPNMRQKVMVNPLNPTGAPIPIGSPYSGLTSAISLSPEIKMVNQELDWRNQFLKENKPVIDQASNVRQSISLLSQSKQNPFAQAVFENTVVSAFGGDKQKSNAEIKRLVNAGSLDQRVANTLSNFLEGTSSASTKEDQKAVLEAVDKALEARYNSSASAWIPGLQQAKIQSDLVIPKYKDIVGEKPTNTMPPEGTVVKNKKTGQMSVVKNGQLMPTTLE